MVLRRPSGAITRLHAAAAAAVLTLLLPLAVIEVAVPVVQVLVGLVVAAVVVVRGRSTGWLPWVIALVLALLATEAAVEAFVSGSDADRVVVLVVQLIGAAVLAPIVFRQDRRQADARGEAPAWNDVALVAVGVGMAVIAVVRAASVHGLTALCAVTLGGDVVCLALVLWFWLSRERLAQPVRQALAAAALYTVHDVTDVLGAPVTAAGYLAQVLAVVVVLLLWWAGSDPQLQAGIDAARARRSSARMHLVLPAAGTPLAVWVSGLLWPATALPDWTVHVSAFAITGLALSRALRMLVEVERAAELDALTGLLGRGGLMRRFDAVVATWQHGWLCLIDLDDFKLVNDQRGHDAGDALLVAIGARLVATLSREATLARLGGDELVAVVRGGTAEQAATSVLGAFAHPFALRGEGEAVRVSASVGVTRVGPTTSVAAALVCADVAMYVAKRRGRDRWVAYDPSLREEVLGVGQVQRELRQLLNVGGGVPGGPGVPGARGSGVLGRPGVGGGPADVGSLVLHYQPVLDLVTGEPIGVEALVRWQHPRRGLVPPDTFLPLAEAAGLGDVLDRWVLHQALHQLVSWDREGLVGLARVAVNLGVSSVRSPSLGPDVEAALRAAGVTHDRLLLEITEHEELQADRSAAECLLRLREAGVTIALDDFGAGYASIGYLRRWPVNVIKLDRSLLPRAIEEGAFEAVDDPAELLDGVAALAGALGHALVAEGIETADDERAVRAVGVRYGQGWLYSRPLPAAELATWWRGRTRPRPPLPVPALSDLQDAGAAAPVATEPVAGGLR